MPPWREMGNDAERESREAERGVEVQGSTRDEEEEEEGEEEVESAWEEKEEETTPRWEPPPAPTSGETSPLSL